MSVLKIRNPDTGEWEVVSWGEKGEPGLTPTIAGATVSLLDNGGSPTARVELGGSELERTFAFYFYNLVGAEKVLVNQGTGNAGRLLYVDASGNVAPLSLGDGLEIVDGVLRVTGSITPETEIVFEAADGGVVTMSGAAFTTLDGGAVQIDAALTDQGGGVVLVS